MGLFGSLSERMSHIFSKLTNKGKLTELEVKKLINSEPGKRYRKN